MMVQGISPLFTLILGLIIGIGSVYFLLRFIGIKLDRLDEKTLLLKLPLLGSIEVEMPKTYRGIFVKRVSEMLEKIRFFHSFVDFQTMLRYANEHNINYIGIEGDMDGKWSKGKLAYNTLSKGYNGGYNIYLNPDLDRESVCHRLSKQLGVEIKPDELYTFLFLHEIGHTRTAGNECYFTAIVNHSLSGGRRSWLRRRKLKDIYSRVERYADDFAIQELLRLRRELNRTIETERILFQDAGYEGSRAC
ncbi:MAG: hypothetical protein QMC83_00400 [Thermodesulfovibrionales bacterium]|nr:hypothetical protein [Thermodesulfovibrionales bacterium]